MKKLLISTTALAMVATNAGAAEMLAALGAPEGQVNIVAWPGYIERGETDAAFDWVTGATPALNVMVRELAPSERANLRAAFIDDVRTSQGEGPFGFEAEAHIAIGQK